MTKQRSEMIVSRAGLPAVKGEANPALAYLVSLRASGRRTQAQVLKVAAEILGFGSTLDCPWGSLTYEHVEGIKTTLGERSLSPASINKTLSALKGVARRAWRAGLMTGETYYRIKDVEGSKGTRLPAGRALSPGEVRALMAACSDGTPAGARDSSLVALGYGCGLRRSELAGLTMADVTIGDGHQATITLIGKGDRQRLAFPSDGALDALTAWLTVRGPAPGRLFWRGLRGGSVVAGQGLTAQSVFDIVNRRAAQAGIEHVGPHDLRRSFITDLLAGGADLAIAAKAAGHQSLETTRLYDRRDEQAVRQAVRSLYVPYVRPGGEV